jgi:hypothetical protein
LFLAEAAKIYTGERKDPSRNWVGKTAHPKAEERN